MRENSKCKNVMKYCQCKCFIISVIKGEIGFVLKEPFF